MEEKNSTHILMDKISPWIKHFINNPEFSDWKKRQYAKTLNYGDPVEIIEILDDFDFPIKIEQQHSAIMSYLALGKSYHALNDMQFYFRRYPFKNLPVSKYDHLRYICEIYFIRFYEFSERLKICLNNINIVIDKKINVGEFIKKFGKEFKAEIKERNHISHHGSFSDISIDKVFLTWAMSSEPVNGKFLTNRHEHAYRKISSEWANRVKKRSNQVRLYLTAVEQMMIEECKFLEQSIDFSQT